MILTKSLIRVQKHTGGTKHFMVALVCVTDYSGKSRPSAKGGGGTFEGLIRNVEFRQCTGIRYIGKYKEGGWAWILDSPLD